MRTRPIRAPKLLAAARGQICTLRIPGVCAGGTETTVAAHRPGGGGMGTKGDDLHIADACAACHDAIDGRTRVGIDREALLGYWWRGHVETMRRRWHDGVIGILRHGR